MPNVTGVDKPNINASASTTVDYIRVLAKLFGAVVNGRVGFPLNADEQGLAMDALIVAIESMKEDVARTNETIVSASDPMPYAAIEDMG